MATSSASEEEDVYLKVTSIELKNLPPGADEHYITLFFEDLFSDEDCVEIKQVFLDPAQNSAVMELLNPDDLQRILDKQPFKMENTNVTAEQFTWSTVEVLGPHDVVCENNKSKLKLHFKNARRSEGGPIAAITLVEPGKAMIRYETEQDARRVANKQRHIFDKKELEAILYHPKNYKSKILLVSDLPEKTNQESLELHLEDKFDESLPVSIDFNKRTHSAYLRFESFKDVELVMEHLPLEIDDKEVNVKWCSIQDVANAFKTCSVDVQGPSSIIAADKASVLKQFFQDESESKCDLILNFASEKGKVNIVFESEEVARHVASKETYEVQGHQIYVKLHEEIGEQRQDDAFDNLNTDSHATNSIQVLNIPTSVDDEYLEEYFDREGESDILSVMRSPDQSSAVIAFEDQRAVDQVVNKERFIIMGQEVTVRKFSPEQNERRTIKVTGPEMNTHQLEKLYIYFTNQRKGGGDVTDHFMRDNAAYFTFKSSEVVMNILEKKHKKGIKVELLKENISKEDVHTDTAKHTKQDVDTINSSNTRSVKVKGIPETTAKQAIELYFESKKRSGGGKVEEILDDFEDKNVKYIKFENHEVAKSVAEKNHTLDKYELKVTLYVPPPCDLKKVLIRGVSEKTTKDSLMNYLEAKCKNKPVDISYHAEQSDIVLVTFENEQDFAKLETACSKSSLEGAMLKIYKVPVSNCIFVENLEPKTSAETIELYFESKRGGEGRVDKVKIDEDGWTCLIFFEDYTVIDDIIQKEHQLCGRLLSIKRYAICLGCPEGESRAKRLKIPDPIEISNVEKYKLKFLKKSEYRAQLEQKLLENNAKINWDSGQDDAVTIECTLSSNDKNVFKLVREWKQRSTDLFQQFLETLADREIAVVPDIWERAKKRLTSININNPDEVCVFPLQDKGVFKIVGKTDAVNCLCQTIEESISELIKDLSKVTEDMKAFKSVELQLLQKMRFQEGLCSKYPDLKVVIDKKANSIKLEGNSNSIRDAQVEIYEKTKGFSIQNVRNISKLFIQLLESEEVRNQIEEKFQKSHIMAAWMIETGELVVCCSDKRNNERSLDVFHETVKEKTLKVIGVDIPDLKTKMWQNYVEGIKRKHPGKVSVTLSSDFSEIVVCATCDVIEKVSELINQFIKCNTVVFETIDCQNDVFELLQKHHQKELKSIKKEPDLECVEISFDKSNDCIQLKCLEKVIGIAREKIEDLLKKVIVQQYTITKPGIVGFMRTQKGKDNLEAIERVHPCRISIVGQDESVQKSNVIAICRIKERRIIASICDITDQDVTLIINPSDENLQLFGGLGRAIASKGGKSIVDACRKHGKLQDGEVFISDGGNLKASHVAHIKSEEWKEGETGEKERLGQIVIQCLMKANILQVKSVAIPAIGCGVNNFPMEVSTKTIVDALRKFFLEVQDSCLEEIHLCDMDINRVNCFVEGMKKVFGPRNVQTFSTDDPPSVTDNLIQRQLGAKSKAAASKKETSVRSKKSTVQKQRTPSEELKRDSGKSVPAKPHIVVKIVKGEIAKQEVDVIVNTAARDLVLTSGFVSRSLFEVAGQGIQDEINKEFPTGLKGKKLAVTGGHGLKCNYVIHTSVAQYDRGNVDKSRQILGDIVSLCLNKANKLKQCTVAFPAIGTGNLCYPHELVAEEMHAAVYEYSLNNPKSNITEVRFVVYPGDKQSVTAFNNISERLRKDPDSFRDFLMVDQTLLSGSSAGNGIFMIGSIGVSAKVGDLLDEEVQCIVNESNEQFEFTQGMSRRLLERCGRVFEEELGATRDEMKAKKIGHTLAPKLQCKYIIHVATQPNNITESVEKCLKLAEGLEVESIGFPAFCTESVQDDHSGLAKDMVKGIKLFIKSKPQHVKEIRFVINDPNQQRTYQAAIEHGSDSKASKPWIKGLWSMFGFGGTGSEKGDDMAEEQAEQELYNRDSVTFNIFSLSKEEIARVKQKIDRCMEGEMKTKKFVDPVIERMDDQQVAELESMMRQQKVHAEIDRDNGKIIITGIKDRVHDASDKIFTFLKDETERNLMAHVVQWSVILPEDNGERVAEYDKDLNIQLERAYQKKEESITFWNSDDEEYVINFDTMEQFPVENSSDTAKVIRRDKVKGHASFEPPSSWDAMTGNMKIVTLDKGCSEYKDLEQTFITSTKLLAITVEKIERIQNMALWEQYQSKKKEMNEVNKGQDNEKYLWHGTAEKTVESINAHGFNRSYCGENAVYYGDGVYFAVDPKYSCRDTYAKPDKQQVQRVYYCRVLTGDFTLGKEKMRVPPPNPARGPYCLFNSVVDEMNESKRQMYIIFHDTQAYPEYLIYFKKSANA